MKQGPPQVQTFYTMTFYTMNLKVLSWHVMSDCQSCGGLPRTALDETIKKALTYPDSFGLGARWISE